MTRDDAIEKVRSTADVGTGSSKTETELLIDALAALGLLKFDEPNNEN